MSKISGLYNSYLKRYELYSAACGGRLSERHGHIEVAHPDLYCDGCAGRAALSIADRIDQAIDSAEVCGWGIDHAAADKHHSAASRAVVTYIDNGHGIPIDV